MLAIRGTRPIGLSPPEILLLAFLAVWMFIPLLCAMLIWRYYISSTTLTSDAPGRIAYSGRFVFVPWTRVHQDTDRAWIIRRRVYRKHGYDISDAVVIRATGRKRLLAGGVWLTPTQLLATQAWLEEVAGVPVKDLRPRVIG